MTTNEERQILEAIGEAFDNGLDYASLIDTFLQEATSQSAHTRRAMAVMRFMAPVERCKVMQMDASL